MTRPADPRTVPAALAAALLLIALVGSIAATARRAEEAAAAAAARAAARTGMLVKVAEVQLQGIENGVLLCKLERGAFPEGNGTEVLRSLAHPPKDEFGDVEPAWLEGHTDPWGNPYNYQWPNPRVKHAKKPAIWSNGPNGVNEDGRGDDIANW
jgi:general secretion pathway protein G